VTPHNFQERLEPIESHAAIAIDTICLPQLLSRIAAPDQTDSWLCMFPQTIAPHVNLAGRRRPIRHLAWDCVQPSAKRQRQAHQRTVHVEVPQPIACRNDLRATRQACHQRVQGALHFKNDARAARRNVRNIAGELDRIAETLLGMQEDGLAGDVLRSKP
jgi:hypothetical protein